MSEFCFWRVKNLEVAKLNGRVFRMKGVPVKWDFAEPITEAEYEQSVAELGVLSDADGDELLRIMKEPQSARRRH